MPDLLSISPELLLIVASFLLQVDLLTVSLTCKNLRVVTEPEPELYREYSFTGQTTSILSFLGGILERPQLSKYVQRLEIGTWTTLDVLSPWRYKGDFLEDQPKNHMIRDAYELFTKAARSEHVIDKILAFEESSLFQRAAHVDSLQIWEKEQDEEGNWWYKDMYGDNTDIRDVSYDEKFCKLLRASIEDPLVALMMALLPNMREVILRGPPPDYNALPWKTPQHRYQSLKFLTVAMEPELGFPVAFFNEILQAPNLEIFGTVGGTVWWRKNFTLLEPIYLGLRSGSLSITRLCFQYCAITATEREKLLNACCSLKAFYDCVFNTARLLPPRGKSC